ncbi:MAG: translocation/assembly module TamB [Muribaculaceae bacterium]|nr:translocation/assembly module TamB [Muribaculaceae bacterium]
MILLYSPWAQGLAREAVTSMMDGSDGGPALSVESFRLRFPLSVEARGIVMSQDGDTMMSAGGARVDIALLPLLDGQAKVRSVVLNDASYRIGGPDSTMYMTIVADSVGLSDAAVALADMSISLPDGAIRGGRMGIYLRPDTSAPTPPAPPTKMSFKVGRIALDDFTYSMRLMPSIDTLTAHIASSALVGGDIDLYRQSIKLGSFSGTGLDARYIAPDSAAIAAGGPYPDAAEEAADSAATSAPWTVAIDSIAFDRSHALYTTAGVVPVPGLDFAYIEVDSLDLRLHDFYNQATTVRLPISLRGRERCGVTLAVDGRLDIDSEALTFTDTRLLTPAGTTAAFSGVLGMGDMAGDPTLPLRLDLDGAFSPRDLEKMFPAFAMYLKPIPHAEDIQLDAALDGTTGRLRIDELALKLNGCVSLSADGYVENFMNPDRLAGNVALKGNIVNVNSFKNALLDPATASTLRIPPMTLAGNVAMREGTVRGRLTARAAGGDIRLDGRWNGTAESYTANLATDRFPVNAFMPDLGVGAVTARLTADGRGYDPFSAKTRIDARLDVASAVYSGVTYRQITGDVSLADGVADVHLRSDSPDAELAVDASGNLDGKVYTWTARVDGRHVDMYALGFSAEPSSIELMANADATIGPSANDIKAHVVVNDLFYTRVPGTIALSDIDLHLDGTDSLTNLTVINRDLSATFNSPVGLDSLITRFGRTSEVLAGQLESFMLDVDTLGRTLPPFDLSVRGGRSNLVNDILAASKMSVRNFAIFADNDSALHLNGYARRFDTGSMRLDSLYVNARQRGEHLLVGAGVENKPGNLDEWHHVYIKALVDGNKAALGVHQQNIKDKTGFRLGFEATASQPDSLITVSIKPYKPVIGYQQWSVNKDNYISYHIPDSHIDANVRMEGGNSSLAVFTEHAAADSLGHVHEHAGEQEDLVIRLSDIHISDWISFNPFAPPVKGDINADMRLNRQSDMFVGKGSAGVTNLIYGREKVADFKADFDVAATTSGTINAKAALFVDGVKTMTVSGALNDSTATSPLDLDFAMIHFPLETANPFLPAGTARLSGTLNGAMKISGTDAHPVFNGTIDFDSTAVRLALTGTPYRFSETPIDVTDNMVRFDRFAISGCNENPLYVDGTVDISDLSNMKLNIGMKADNMQIVNSNRASKGADVYGKAFISLDAGARGNMSFMSVNADLKLLSETNVTYVIPDATNALTNRSNSDMVKFVNFTDSLAVAEADTLATSGMAMLLDATLTIEDGSTVNVDLSADGKNRASVQSNGKLTFAMTPLDDGRLTGRLDIDKGFVRYTPPFMSEKYFTFMDGSYVAFNGEMMNPTLNVKAVDVIKANVTQSGQNSRLVNFDVLLSVTGTLNRLDVSFDLSTNDDMTVANELESMSPEQRANQAMNMLLYNVYTGPGTKGNASLSGNPLFSFLESQINTWAANNIKGIDISFGIDQYDRTVNGSTSSTMSYSYQVSKSLFNDRFKIVVGGNYSTDANADENFSQNLINDISFEYFLNRQRTMYLRLFRHTGYESILEGEITQTGVGFVYRRKLRRIGDMFLPRKVAERREKERNERESRINVNDKESAK